jgi:hypothetical protein
MALIAIIRKGYEPFFTNDEPFAEAVTRIRRDNEILFERFLKLEMIHEQLMAESRRLKSK